MGRNPEKDALQTAQTRQRILESALRVFASETIEKVTMMDVARAAGIGVATLYRYYGTKSDLVLAVGTWVWEAYYAKALRKPSPYGDSARTAAEEFEYYLESFLELYRNHRDILRFNQFFNIYVQREGIPPEQMRAFGRMIGVLSERFHRTYQKGRADGTLRTDMPEQAMFSTTLHLMLAVVTRYAVGLAYTEGTDAEAELALMKRMLIQTFVRTA